MKNIFILSTDKLSRLHFDGKLFLSINPQISREINSIVQGRNIYITNDEEIKENTNVKDKWVISEYGFVVKADRIENNYLVHSNGGSNFFHHYKFIILTTDQDLIKNGVQPIDDEFLEWFVKNPSCKEIKVFKDKRLEEEQDFHFYEIIIPNLETWKDVPDFEGYYQVSNVGNVKSLSRTILGKNNTPTLLKEKLLKFSTSTNGYYQVILCKNSDRKIFKVHSLVAICFLNHISDGTHNIVIDHINEIHLLLK